MKKSELNFKCILGSKKRNRQMLDAIVKANLKNSIQESNFIDNAACLWINDSFFGEVSPTYACIISDNYESCESPEVTFAEALLLLNNVEPDAPEFDIRPFEETLMRDRGGRWEARNYGRQDDARGFLSTSGGTREQVIKFKGNAHFHNTTGNPPGWWESKDGAPIWKTK